MVNNIGEWGMAEAKKKCSPSQIKTLMEMAVQTNSAIWNPEGAYNDSLWLLPTMPIVML